MQLDMVGLIYSCWRLAGIFRWTYDIIMDENALVTCIAKTSEATILLNGPTLYWCWANAEKIADSEK